MPAKQRNKIDPAGGSFMRLLELRESGAYFKRPLDRFLPMEDAEVWESEREFRVSPRVRVFPSRRYLLVYRAPSSAPSGKQHYVAVSSVVTSGGSIIFRKAEQTSTPTKNANRS